MRAILATLVVVMWAAVLLGDAFRPQAFAPGAAPRPQPGYRAPDFSLTDTSGQTVKLSDFQGQAVFLNFWASWCAPCRLEMPEMQRLQADLPPGTAILTVNMTAQESSAEVPWKYMRQMGYTFPALLDRTGDVGELYQVLSLPTSLFIDRQGIVTARISGPLSHGAMADYLKGR